MSRRRGAKWVALVRIGQYLGLLAFAFLAFPAQWGGYFQTTVVSGTSMLPTYEGNDFVISFRSSAYSVGDVIVYHPESLDCTRCNVVHRVVEVKEDGTYVTKGDNNPNVDVWNPASKEVYGKVVQRISLGSLAPILLSPWVWIFILCNVGAMWLFGYIRETLALERANTDKE